MKSVTRIAIALVLVAALILPSPLALACGPYFPIAVFTGAAGPDDPVAYAAGKLQLLQPTYWHRPLFIAYRNLIGKPFSQAELKVLTTEPRPDVQFQEVQTTDAKPAPSPEQEWLIARAKALGLPTPSPDEFSVYVSNDNFQRGDNYVFYRNCLDGAYRNAVTTLDKRVAQFGAQSHIVQDWITAQDQVFANCSRTASTSKPKHDVIPASARESDPEIVRADRAYQIAAASFYIGDYDEAISEFNSIAQDKNSPYATMAPYLVARALVRRGTLGNAESEPAPDALDQAETKLRDILADKNLVEIHPASQRLLSFVTIRIHPRKRFRELESLLNESAVADTPTAGFDQDLTDYLWMLDHEGIMAGELVSLPTAESSKSPGIVPGDMTDWILTFQAQGQPAYRHALQRWQETKSLVWLVAAISKAGASESAAGELIAASEKIPPDSPAWTTLAFHRLRLLSESGNSAETRSQLDRILSQAQFKLDHSAKNQFVALRMKLAANLDEFLRYAPRDAAIDSTPGEFDPYSGTFPPRPDTSKISPFLDADSALPLSKSMPLRVLVDAAKSTSLPRELRREIIVAAWTRAILLDRQSTARDLTPLVENLIPELGASLAGYDATQESSSQRFAAVFAILQNPGFDLYVRSGLPREEASFNAPRAFNKMDSFGDNWWCAPAPLKSEQGLGDRYPNTLAGLSGALRQIYPDGKIPSPAFLTDADRAEAQKEVTLLASLPAAPTWLGQQTIDFAKTNPGDPRVPEALHLVVRASRYGCSDDSLAKTSKQAFTLLHNKYPGNAWTKETPYWFGSEPR